MKSYLDDPFNEVKVGMMLRDPTNKMMYFVTGFTHNLFMRSMFNAEPKVIMYSLQLMSEQRWKLSKFNSVKWELVFILENIGSYKLQL